MTDLYMFFLAVLFIVLILQAKLSLALQIHKTVEWWTMIIIMLCSKRDMLVALVLNLNKVFQCESDKITDTCQQKLSILCCFLVPHALLFEMQSMEGSV